MTFIDTHAHLYADEFKEDWPEVLGRIKDAGLEKIYLPNIDSSSIVALKELQKSEPNFFKGMMGLHPCSVQGNYKEELQLIKAELESGDYCAIGEIGMDLHWDKSTKDIQTDAFKIQCKWASEKKLPIAIHSRESTRELIEILKENKEWQITGVFHCFSGTAEEAREIVDLGFYLGIGGVVTFKNSGLRNELGDIPLEKILLETDSPYLAPAPHRGKRNESSYLPLIADELSNIYSVSIDKIAEATTANALELFG